jgi:hypothetical protein
MIKSRIEIPKICLSGVLILLGALPGFAIAQGLPAEVEGTITDIQPNATGTGVTVTVMGIAVNVDEFVFTSGHAKTPSEILYSSAELLGNPLPGRASVKDDMGNPVAGFIGGTAISIGTTTLAGGFQATDLFVEVAENVVLGTVTSVVATGYDAYGKATCDISVEGTPVIFSTEYRTKFGTAINGSGFEVKPCTLFPGDTISIEGYYGDEGLYIFALESDDADVVNTGVTTVSRASCDRGKIEVRGSSTLPNGTAVLKSLDGSTTFGSVTLINDAVTGTSIYRYRDKSDAGFCPSDIRVESYDWDLTVSPVPAMNYDSFTTAPIDVK